MTSFTALNIIPDSDSDSEVDNTLELQIEEALKIYQKAIKAHSEGNWNEAESAYDELFKSEIFEQAEIVVDETTATSASSSIHSILFLAFKNHAAFLLDRLKTQRIINLKNSDTLRSIELGLIWFAEALARDPGDSALWRNTAQISKVFNSSRLARFCLESVLQRDTDVDEPADLLELTKSGLRPDDFLACLQLRDVLNKLQDETTFSAAFFQWLRRKKAKPSLQKLLEPYPWLNVSVPALKHEEVVEIMNFNTSGEADTHILHIQSRTWSAIGKMLLKRRHTVDEKNPFHLSNYICLEVPPASDDSPSTTPTASTPQETTPESVEIINVEDGDVQMAEAEAAPTVGEIQRDSTNRKRKSTSLGGPDEPGRSRLSKRVRDRENANAAAAPPPPPVRQLVSQDDKLFTTVEKCFSPLGVSLGKASALKIRGRGEDEAVNPNDRYLRDFQTILRHWDDDKGNVILYGEGIQDPKEEATPGTALLSMEVAASTSTYHPALTGGEGLRKWLKAFNKEGIHVKEFCMEWLKALLMREYADKPGSTKLKNDMLAGEGKSSWLRHSWPEPLKDVVVAMVTDCEELLWSYFKEWEVDYNIRLVNFGVAAFGERDLATIEFAQSVFEIYLGVLAVSDKERASLDTEELQEKWDTLRDTCRRWSYLVGDLIHCRPRDKAGELPEDQLTFRYLWASAVFTGLNTNASRDFVLDCFEDLKKTLSTAECTPIELPNSTVMPEISVAKAEREISKLKTMDFFTSIFRATTHMLDPIEVIANLEAVLDPQSVADTGMDDADEQHLDEMARFLEGSSSQFKLYLWERLREAYEHETINFTPKVLTCRLKCIGLIVSEFDSPTYLDHSEDHRQFILLRAIRLLESTIPATLKLALDDPESLSLDTPILILALKSLFSLLRLLHTYSFYEDGVMNSEYSASNLHSYRLVVVKFREMLVKTWCLAYLIYRELIEPGPGTADVKQKFELPDEPWILLGTLLKDVHDELGVRNYCKLSSRDFLKLMQSEYLRFDLRAFDEELAQCLHCRYHLKVGPDQWKLYEHKTDPETLDREHALEILDFILLMASRKRIQQLPKAEVKSSLDKVVEVIGLPKKSPKLTYNEGVLEQYLAGSIHPLRLFHSLKGIGHISCAPITGDYATASAKGFYFLMGHMHLSMIRDRSVKTRAQVKGDDLDMALKYFKYTLMFDPENWEAWWRLAQTHGQQIDEDMCWTADTMNNQKGELVKKERRCILSFIMAVSTSVRSPVDSEEAGQKLACMYYEFAYRIYTSSRPPMSMEAWHMDEFVRHFSGTQGQGMYKQVAHKEVTPQMALRFAVVLLERALLEDPENWKFHYIMGKCMGKLEKEYGMDLYAAEEVLERYTLAAKYAPEKASSELLLEPHHKLVSAACKYVLHESIQPAAAYNYVSTTPYAKGTAQPSDRPSFLTLTLNILSKMKQADKQKWHHRMTHRIAALLDYNVTSSPSEGQNQDSTIAAAKELSSLFSTKASTLGFWRPENERPGRHFVFAYNYTTFYVKLLSRLQDRTTLEAIAKRVRKNASGLWKYPLVWEETCRAYVSVLRSTGGVEDKLEEKVFSGVGWDEFQAFSARLEAYCNPVPPATGGPAPAVPQHLMLDLFREVVELRRLNMGFGKQTEIDDLLADTYAKLYRDLIPEIMSTESVSASAPAPTTSPSSPSATNATIVVTRTTPPTTTPTATTTNNPMSLRNLMFDELPSTPNGGNSGAATGGTVTPTGSTALQLAANHAKMDSDLPLRGKLTKVARRDVISKASNLFKPAPTGTAAKAGGATSSGAGSQAAQTAAQQLQLEKLQQQQQEKQLAEQQLQQPQKQQTSSGRGSGVISGAGAAKGAPLGDTVFVGGLDGSLDEVMASPPPDGGEDGGEEGDDEREGDGDDPDDDGDVEVMEL